VGDEKTVKLPEEWGASNQKTFSGGGGVDTFWNNIFDGKKRIIQFMDLFTDCRNRALLAKQEKPKR